MGIRETLAQLLVLCGATKLSTGNDLAFESTGICIAGNPALTYTRAMRLKSLCWLLLAGSVQAETLRIEPPTKNTDGTTIPATGPGSISGIRIEYGSCSGTAFGVKAGELNMTPPNMSTVLSMPPAQYCFRAYAKNTYGAESAPTNVLVYTLKPPTPGVATILIEATP